MIPRRHHRPPDVSQASDRLLYAAGVAFRASILAGIYRTSRADHAALRLRQRGFNVGELLATVESGQIVATSRLRGTDWISVGYLGRILIIVGAALTSIEFASLLPVILTVYEPDPLPNAPLRVPVCEYVHQEIAELMQVAL